MGSGASRSPDSSSHGGEEREESLDQAGGQLYVSLKMENYKLKGDLIPHVHGSVPLIGSWDSSKAVSHSLLVFFQFTIRTVVEIVVSAILCD